MTAAEFWAMASPVPYLGCWIHSTSTGTNLYGYANVEGTRERVAHRVAWVLANGREIPRGSYVLHRCDVKGCVNPQHIRIGTAGENVHEVWERGARRNKASQ